ncbi:MAG: PQ-loop repeat-containing protein [Alphaproteobacteria bacterium]|nr:PQ-loop repeat-containing protein [Alphaproteobacteria bacterium]
MKTIFVYILLIIYTVVSLYAYMPQVIKLIRTKSSNDLSLSSWMFWILSYLCYLGYVLIESPDLGIIFITCLELFFTILICILILLYRKPKKKQGAKHEKLARRIK